jgi:hypothetical protein
MINERARQSMAERAEKLSIDLLLMPRKGIPLG